MSQCTFWCSVLSDMNLPYIVKSLLTVSMHLLVLSAFRLKIDQGFAQVQTAFQCTFWCSVLSDQGS